MVSSCFPFPTSPVPVFEVYGVPRDSFLFVEIAPFGCCLGSLYSFLPRGPGAVLDLQLLFTLSCLIFITIAFPFHPSRHRLF